MYLLILNLFLFASQVLTFEPRLLQDFNEANRKFTSDVFREVANSNKGNFLICPMSAEIILGLVRFGAKGNTAKELSLYIQNSDEEARKIFVEINKESTTNEYTLTSANNIFLSHKYTINDNFKQIAYGDFKAGIQNVDFSKPQETVDYINTWVERKTNNKIKNVLATDHIDAQTVVILINTMYFHGNWLEPFDGGASLRRKFFVTDKTAIETDMMITESHFNYYDNAELNAQFLELPFEGGDVTMTFVLPKERFGLYKLEENIFDVLLPQKYKKEEVEVLIPKFKMESQIDLKPILQSMGVRDAFDRNADFSGMVNTKESLAIDAVFQKTFLEINEKGATAAASTAVIVTALSMPQNTFYADHPFLFYLKHKTNGILFIGKFATPTV